MSRPIDFESRHGKIYIDGEEFDWGLEDEEIMEANKHVGNPEFMRAIHNDIMSHFLNSLQEVLGFRPTMKQVNEAIKKGHIQKCF